MDDEYTMDLVGTELKKKKKEKKKQEQELENIVQRGDVGQ